MGVMRFLVHPVELLADWPEVHRAYISGVDQFDGSIFHVDKSFNAEDGSQTPSFGTSDVDLGGQMVIGTDVNPAGLLGQAIVRINSNESVTGLFRIKGF